MKKTMGFTLLEMMIVVAIIAILAALIIPQLLQSRKMSRQNRCLNNLKVIEYAREQFGLNVGLKSGQTLTPQMASLNGFKKFIKNPSTTLFCPSNTANVIIAATFGVAVSCSYHGSIATPTPLGALTAN